MAPETAVSWSRVSSFIADAMGLYFSPARWGDLERGLAGAAKELGFEDVMSCADWLLSSPLTREQLQVLASHLTIGETYFFREKKTFDVLRDIVLPELIQARRGRQQRLRLWSAGCCSGEEAYSLAILLHQVLPDLVDWQVTILATDINAHFLRKALAGTYGEWSFRDAPVGLKQRYFTRRGDGRYVVMPEIKGMVTVQHMNLVDDVYPSLVTNTNAMDLILCRNVLMYFTPSQTQKVIGKLHRSLIDGAWLSVSPSEASQALFPQFETRNFPGVILYQKTGATVRRRETPVAAPFSERAERSSPSVATPLYAQGRYAEAADTLLASFPEHAASSEEFSLLARSLANQGRLTEALAWCDRWIDADKLNSGGHYLRAVVLLEQGNQEEARSSLQRAAYLHPDFVLAHFALGSTARGRGKTAEADRHFRNALQLLARLRPDELLPESDGLTAGRLAETIATLTGVEQAS